MNLGDHVVLLVKQVKRDFGNKSLADIAVPILSVRLASHYTTLYTKHLKWFQNWKSFQSFTFKWAKFAFFEKGKKFVFNLRPSKPSFYFDFRCCVNECVNLYHTKHLLTVKLFGVSGGCHSIVRSASPQLVMLLINIWKKLAKILIAQTLRVTVTFADSGKTQKNIINVFTLHCW